MKPPSLKLSALSVVGAVAVAVLLAAVAVGALDGGRRPPVDRAPAMTDGAHPVAVVRDQTARRDIESVLVAWHSGRAPVGVGDAEAAEARRSVLAAALVLIVIASFGAVAVTRPVVASRRRRHTIRARPADAHGHVDDAPAARRREGRTPAPDADAGPDASSQRRPPARRRDVPVVEFFADAMAERA